MAQSSAAPSIDYSDSIFMGSSNVYVNANRLNWRAEVLIHRNQKDFEGKRVLDLASHDSRFSHAALSCGASNVVCVEARPEHVEQARANLQSLNYDPNRYDVVCSDLVDYLKGVQPGDFDTILCFGVWSHLIEQVEILREIKRIAPSAFFLDTWVAREKWNFIERKRNHRVNSFVGETQQGWIKRRSPLRFISALIEYTTSPTYRTGSLIFLYEDSNAPGATIRKSGLMAWSTPSVVEILFEHFGFEHERVDWRSQNISDWTELGDYRRHDRESWIARLKPNADDGDSNNISILRSIDAAPEEAN